MISNIPLLKLGVCVLQNRKGDTRKIKRGIIFIGTLLLLLLKKILRGISYYFLHNQVHFQRCNVIGVDSRAPKKSKLAHVQDFGLIFTNFCRPSD